MMAEMRTNQLPMREKMDSIQEEIIAKMATHQERTEANMNTWGEGLPKKDVGLSGEEGANPSGYGKRSGAG
jgi:hypothetical protein